MLSILGVRPQVGQTSARSRRVLPSDPGRGCGNESAGQEDQIGLSKSDRSSPTPAPHRGRSRRTGRPAYPLFKFEGTSSLAVRTGAAPTLSEFEQDINGPASADVA